MMEANEVWKGAYIAFSDSEYATDEATAIIEQAIRDAITEDRRSRTFTISELDKARAEGIAEGMERAAVIVDCDFDAPHIIDAGRKIATAIRAAKGTGDAG